MALQTANDIKINVLNWAIAHLKDGEVLASEIRFMDGLRRADLAILSESKLAAIEIKGPRDNLSTLESQIFDYSNAFLEVYIACAPTFLKQVRSSIPTSVGIVLATETGVHVARSARQRRRLSAESAAAWLTRKDFNGLHAALGTDRRMDLTALRERAREIMTETELSAYALACIRRRASARHDSFVDELGKTMTLDDVQMLTVEGRIKL